MPKVGHRLSMQNSKVFLQQKIVPSGQQGGGGMSQRLHRVSPDEFPAAHRSG